MSFALERVGAAPLTSNCAELHAELHAPHATLRLRVWVVEGFGKISDATDSGYVVCGAS